MYSYCLTLLEDARLILVYSIIRPTHRLYCSFAQTANVKTTGKKAKNGNKKDTIPKVIEEKPEKKPTIKVETKAMSWGGGRSFVDVIKNKENATASS
jgi:F0F1-type ATP synthase delta subunit